MNLARQTVDIILEADIKGFLKRVRRSRFKFVPGFDHPSLVTVVFDGQGIGRIEQIPPRYDSKTGKERYMVLGIYGNKSWYRSRLGGAVFDTQEEAAEAIVKEWKRLLRHEAGQGEEL
jgi:hypothetical protein